MTPVITWLHLSDVHFGHGDAAYRKDQELILAELLTDVRRLAQSSDVPRPDVILMTGDIAFSGRSEEYRLAQSWFEHLGEVTGVKRERMFFVPGNHDVIRCNSEKNQDAFYRIAFLRGTGDIDNNLAEPREVDVLLSRLAPYLGFCRSFGPQGLHSSYAWVRDLPCRAGVDVRLVGLNTALLCNDDSDYQQLQLGRAQLQLCAAADAEPRPAVVVALTHHPLEWLRDETLATSWLTNHAHVHLSGHAHRLQTQWMRSGTGAELVRVVAGAGHDEPCVVKPEHGYSIGQLALVNEQIVLRV